MTQKIAARNASELRWFKSSYSDSSNPNDCVEVATRPRRRPRPRLQEHARPRLALTPAAWAGFVAYAARR
ncbi:DUF397 domain-containing protein [Streptomyces sp. Cmuel-A718b]|uniref:DUF397 domain-containing protein n=1 Tax=Streptomyces sp. Cmuel-A718b TaxID=697328 RepID=UPI000B844F04|nr:DUF397 domain-containing protein [Streptomyces sp. Cmuel-A718b]